MEIEKFQQIFRDIIQNGKTFRNIEEEYGVNRESIMKLCKSIFPEGSKELEKFQKIIEYNIETLKTSNIPRDDLNRVAHQLFSGEIGIEEAASLLNIDRITFRDKLIDFVLNSNDEELIKRYVKFEAKAHPDYSHINFPALLIEMINGDYSQTEIASRYGIPSRTIGREIEKLQNNEYYKTLYEICKKHSHRKMIKEDIGRFEKEQVKKELEKYHEVSVIVKGAKTEEQEKYERARIIIQIAEDTPGTLREKSKAAGVSESTLRRIKKMVETYEKKRKLLERKDEGEAVTKKEDAEEEREQ